MFMAMKKISFTWTGFICGASRVNVACTALNRAI